MQPKLILHGGIESTEGDTKAEKEQALEHICRAAYDYLKENTAINSVEFAIRMLEDNPLFNAGTGAILQADGVQRMDACIIDGSNSKAGAVAQIQGVKNPIMVARLVMEKSPHYLIVGEEAQKFAYRNGVEMYTPLTREAMEKWFKLRDESHYGTIGAVAIDKDGKIAAGTSTGGWATSLPGRVGDVPIIGAGTYANEYVGVSCTGHGEKILAIGLSRLISFYIEEHSSLTDAANKSLERLKKINGVGGFIAVDFRGNVNARATENAYMPVFCLPK